MIRATINEEVPLQVQVGGGENNLYARAKIYDVDGSLFDTVSLTHVDNGLYGDKYTFTDSGYYTVVYQLFNDPGFTEPSDYDIEAESIEANSDKTNITRILGLTHDNIVMDNHIYDAEDNLLSARIRHYDSKANADAAGSTGLLNTWDIEATYSSGRLESYSVKRQ